MIPGRKMESRTLETAPLFKRPTLAIVGRPNVGKSALFNAICKRRIAIVDEAEGITRDRLYSETDLFGLPFRIVDTGGVNVRSEDDYQAEINRQVEIALEEADTIIMVVDSRIGLTVLDEEMARLLHRTKKPVCLAVNKVDNIQSEEVFYEFLSLGFKKMQAVSAIQGNNLAELLTMAFESYEPTEAIEEVQETPCQVALVGRPNVGKSSLLNHLLEEERSIVSPIPGTTRDSIDATFAFNDDEYIFIDTAGIRRKKVEHEVVEKYAFIRTKEAIERANVCLLMLDAQEGLTSRDKKIANMIEEAGKGCILLLNKWDLVKGFRMEHCLRSIREENPFLKHCPVICISAKTGRNTEDVFPLIQKVFSAGKHRVTTPMLNTFIEKTLQKNHPPMIQGKRLRIYYMTQVAVEPPAFILFTNYTDRMTETYKRYIHNQFRSEFGFDGVPLRFYLRGKNKDTRNPYVDE